MPVQLTGLARTSRAIACHLYSAAHACAAADVSGSCYLACQRSHQCIQRGSSQRLHCTLSALQRQLQHPQQHQQQHCMQAASLLQQSQLHRTHLVPQQHIQLRHYAADEAARRRLAAAQQRRQREQELQERRAAAAAAADTVTVGSSSDAVVPPPPAAAAGDGVVQDPHSTALTPQETPPTAVQVQNVVGHEALIVTRSIEWGTLILGFEQATKYTVYDQDGNIVALIAEEQSGIGNEIQRQLLRTRRSFTSTVLSADGSQVVFRVRRPAYLINSYMYIEDPQGEVIGEVRQRWHLWRRNYDLYLGRRQFAAINGGFLAWEFEMKDGQGNTLALIDRNFLGFAKEIFTDAGKYVVHFGYSPQQSAELSQRTIAARSGQADVSVTQLAVARTDVAVIPTFTGNQLVVHRPLELSERLIALAAAISVDYNFFSQHSNSSGLFSPPLFMPLPLPGGGGVGGGAAAGGAEGAAGGAAAGGPGAAGGAAAGAEAAGPASGTSMDQQPAGFGGTDDAGFSSGLGAQGPQAGFGDDAESFKWDTGSDAGSSVGGDEGGWGLAGGGGGDDEGPSGLWGLLVSIWAMVFGE